MLEDHVSILAKTILLIILVSLILRVWLLEHDVKQLRNSSVIVIHKEKEREK